MEACLSASPEISAGCQGFFVPGRDRPKPSERNLQIYEAVRLQGQRQVDIARETGLSQRRVSQICQQVEAWRNLTGASANPRNNAERAHVERQLLRRQLERTYNVAIEQAHRGWQPIVIEREGVRDGRPWRETVRKDQGPSVQWLKLAMRAMELIMALDAQPTDRAEAAWLAHFAAQARELAHDERSLARESPRGQSEAADISARSSRSSTASGEPDHLLAQGVDCSGDTTTVPAGSCDEPVAAVGDKTGGG